MLRVNNIRWPMPLFCLAALSSALGGELKVDINRDSKDFDQYTETGYVKWSAGTSAGSTSSSGTTPIVRSFTTASGEGVTVAFAQTPASASAGGQGITFVYHATAVSGTADLVGDGLTVNPSHFATGGQLLMTITGLDAGEHTLLTYHNAGDAFTPGSLGPIDVYVDGSLVLDDLPQTIRKLTHSAAASSYVWFTVTGPSEPATILFAAETTAGSYSIRNPMINGFEIDTPDIYRAATGPHPAAGDEHVNADAGTVTLSWVGALAGDTASRDVYFGTDLDAVRNADTHAPTFLGNQAGTHRTVVVDDAHATYYWRVDEINTSGDVTMGTVWYFRPRSLAFPGAEGYGRFARGGRGGRVVHVTSLADYASGQTPIRGTLRYAIEEETGPRVIVFDVAGLITIKERLTLSDDYVTVAGQTAPGKGICLRGWPLGLSGATDAVVRFVRNRPGDISGVTIDGGGLAGCNHSIMDHCSISWSIDEGFSSRDAQNITLQRTLISEALNISGHQNYPPGKEHGYAASVGGDIASLHHNLLAHNEGRNWSMAGGLDAQNHFAGRLDIRNNVVYNWKSRTTDGGAMEVNFVGNYYKPGAATTHTPWALTMNHEDNFGGMQRCHFAGNVMLGYFDESNQSAGRRSVVDSGVPPPDYSTFVVTPFFDHHITTSTALGAYKRVLSDVGCNRPLDDHDVRVIEEVLNRTYTYTGTGPYGGFPGLPNSQQDVGGWEDYWVETRLPDWDTDRDGLPDWWETIHGTATHSPPDDFSDANTDPEIDGYTRLDDYLAWMALPRLYTAPGTHVDIDLATLTVGYTNVPVHQVSAPVPAGSTVQLLPDGHTARFMPAPGHVGIAEFQFRVTDEDADSMRGKVVIRVASPHPASLALNLNKTGGTLEYHFQGPAGTDHNLEYSIDLANPLGWTLFKGVSASGNLQTFDLPAGLSNLEKVGLRASR